MLITVKILNEFLSKFEVKHNNMLKDDKTL